VTSCLPRAFGAPAVLVLATILAGCGGSGGVKPPQQVAGPGFGFAAPAGWHVVQSGELVSAGSGSDLVQVARFRLLRPYSAALFEKVEKELDVRMAAVAKQTAGRVDGSRVVTAAGIRSHSYDVVGKGRIDEYTFVLRGMREYQLLCRRSSSDSDANCRLLTSTFRIG
jgi:hypothetical protein